MLRALICACLLTVVTDASRPKKQSCQPGSSSTSPSSQSSAIPKYREDMAILPQEPVGRSQESQPDSHVIPRPLLLSPR